MRSTEFITEGLSHPIIAVDIQPEYAYYGDNENICRNAIKFVAKATGPVLMFVNAEDTGMSGDSVQDIKQFWNDTVDGEPEYNDETEEYIYPESNINWSRFQIVDKGFGYLRAWMDHGIDPAKIIKTIRLMYQQRVTDSRMLFGGQDSPEYEQGIKSLLGPDYLTGLDDPISVEWTSVAQLKKFSGAYIVGGGRDSCLREVELLMNAFNIRYKRIDSLVYG